MSDKGAPDDRRLLVESPAPRTDVARGFAVSGEAEDLLRRFEAEPHTESVDLGEHAHGLRVHRWRLDPAVAEVSAKEITGIDGASARTPAGSYLLDSRRNEVLLRFRDRGQRLELSLLGGRVAVFSLGLRRSDLPTFEPLVAALGVAPSDWLREHLLDLEATDDGVAAVASAGALIRFFGPHPDDSPALGPPVVVRGARAWARSIRPEIWDRLEDNVVDRVKELHENLRSEGADVLDLARQRDMLQSFATTIRLVGRGERVRDELSTLDRWALTDLTRLTEACGSSDDPCLRAVAWSEPEAWWGTLAR